MYLIQEQIQHNVLIHVYFGFHFQKVKLQTFIQTRINFTELLRIVLNYSCNDQCNTPTAQNINVITI